MVTSWLAGDEKGLLSPTADALALASVIDLRIPARVLITGAGLDGELPAAYVLDRISQLGGNLVSTLAPIDVTPYSGVIDWHPSEATALVIAAALGHRGTVEIRDAGRLVILDPNSPHVYEVSAEALYAESVHGRAIAGSATLEAVEQSIREVCGRSEIDYERRKAAFLVEQADNYANEFDVAAALRDYAPQARTRGIDYLTVRRIAELSGAPAKALPVIRDYLARVDPGRFQPPLWSTAA